MRRRTFLAAAGGALAAAGLGGCGRGGPRAPLRIALHSWPGFEFMRLAQVLGWLPPEVARIEHSQTLYTSVAALRRGDVDAAGITLDETLKLQDAGVPVRVVLVFDVSMGADALLARPGIDTLADLRGRRVGAEDSALGGLMLGRALAAGGLVRADVEVVPLEADHVASFESGRMDAIVTYEPAATRLRGLGLHALFDSRQLPQLVVDVLAVRAEAMERHAAGLAAAIAAHFRALERWRSNRVDTAHRLATQLQVVPEEVPDLFRGLDVPDAIYNREFLLPPATELTRASRELARFLAAESLLTRPAAFEELFVADFLPADAT